jgi:hypothetical protein
VAKHTLQEWWAIYCLRFGPDALNDVYAKGEREFLLEVADDLEVPPLSDLGLRDSANPRAGHRIAVIALFSDLRMREKIAARKP